MKARIKVQALSPIGNVDDPQGFYCLGCRFLAYRREKQYSLDSQRTWTQHLNGFLQWCDERGLSQPREITRPILEHYQRYLHRYRKPNGQPLSVSSQNGRISPLRAWFKWLVRNDYLLSNPASDLDSVRQGLRLPRHILTAEQLKHLMALPDVSTALGVRDRAILETLYSTGLRRIELAQLDCGDVHYERGIVHVHEGKGNKDRVVPIGEQALYWLTRYLQVRDSHLHHGPTPALFVDSLGQSISPQSLSNLVKEYLRQAEISAHGSCHLLRHACATHMLENGADVRLIQALLGHKDLGTTSIYTQVSIQKLKSVHTLTHPSIADRISTSRDP